jgi:hypothetical protein
MKTTTANTINTLVEEIRDLNAELDALHGGEWFARERIEIALAEATAALAAAMAA